MRTALFETIRVAEGRWSASGRDRFAEERGYQFGGYILGLLISALMLEPSRKGSPIAVTCAFVSRVKNAPLSIVARCLRVQDALTFWQMEVLQGDDDAVCAHAVITLAERSETSRFGWIEMPNAAPPESLPAATQGPPMVISFDRRLVRGFPPTAGDSTSIAWVREDDGEPVDHARLAMFADLFPPRVYYAAGMRPSSTVSLTMYFHATPDEVDAIGPDFVLQHGTGRRGSAGIFDMTASLWRRDGVLLATTEQLCWFR
jgi:acyl-coenzyme A thioesterase PaaI-like protein